LARLGGLSDLLVAFSGGVDSSVLLHAATWALGARAEGFVADSPSLPRQELADACAFAASIGARLVVVPTDELSREGYRANAGARCYHCKATLFEAMAAHAREHGFTTLAFGEIADDLHEDRPGATAARELGVIAPLSAVGFTKDDVRDYARTHGLYVAEKPASACLASRIPSGTEVNAARLQRIERAEAGLRALGLCVLRVRDHGTHARVEVGASELERAAALEPALRSVLASQGFTTLALERYRSPLERISAGRSAAPPPEGRGPGS
jgi:uncharacterized protein